MDVMPGYKQTEVGLVPKGWGVCRLGQLLQDSRTIRYGVVQPGTFDATGCFMLRSQDYSKGWAGPDGMHKISPQLEHQYRNARIHRGDLVMTVVGAGIGQVVVVPGWLNGTILSRSTARIAIDENRAAPNFVKAFLESPVGKRQILDCQKEGAQPVVSCPDMAKFFVAVPPLPEQRAIAAALSDVDALLGGLDRLIAKKRDLKQAAMQQLLTGQTRLPGFHGEWEVKRLGEIATIKDGTHQTPRYVKSGIPFYSVEHVTSGDFVNTKFISKKEHQFLTRSVKIDKGDILMTRIGSIGDCKLIDWDIDASFYVSLALLKVRPSYSAAFIAHYSNTVFFKKEIELNSLQSAIPKKINLGPISNIQIKVPPILAEQSAIAAVLSDMDAELAALEARRDKTRALKQAMMQELLTGRTRLV